jgi:hypothetical protein
LNYEECYWSLFSNYCSESSTEGCTNLLNEMNEWCF